MFATKVSFHGTEKTKALEALISQQTSKVERLCPRVQDCRIAISKEAVHVELRMGRNLLHVTKPATEGTSVAVRDAFEVIDRALRERPRS